MPKLLLIVVGGYLVVAMFMFLNQHRMLYLPDIPGRALVATPADLGLEFDDVWVETVDGLRLHGWWIPADGPLTLLFFHGNAGNISHRLQSIGQFRRLGFSVLIIDYRGYGRSEGTPDEQGTYSDAEAAWNYLTRTLEVPPERVVVFGRSLGAAIAAWLAAHRPAGALIVESAFTSVPDLGQELYPFLPVRWLSRFRYATRDYVARTGMPVLVVHSRDDEIVGFHHGREIFEAAAQPRMLLELAGSHNDANVVSEMAYLAGIEAFVDEHVSAGSRPEEPVEISR